MQVESACAPSGRHHDHRCEKRSSTAPVLSPPDRRHGQYFLTPVLGNVPPPISAGQWNLERSALGLGCVKREKPKQRSESLSSIAAISKRKCSVSPVADATSEKFILASVLLNAFLHSQGHDRHIEACHGWSAPRPRAVHTAGRTPGLDRSCVGPWPVGVGPAGASCGSALVPPFRLVGLRVRPVRPRLGVDHGHNRRSLSGRRQAASGCGSSSSHHAVVCLRTVCSPRTQARNSS
jgi:hypothetical protein